MVALEGLTVLMRWVHIISAVLLVGGVAYARTVAMPVLQILPADERLDAWQRLTERYRPLVYSAIAGLVVSGVYNLMTHPGHTRFYQLWFGIKMLLAAHVFAAGILMVRAPEKTSEKKLARQMSGILISGLAVILIGSFLRRIF